jgi:APA family basic amino acid/polyamine antiporter
VRDPGRSIPFALVAGMALVALVYCLANLSYFYAVPFADVVTSNSTRHRDALPVATKAAQTFLGDGGGRLVSIAFILSTLGALNGSVLANARVPFAMARDGVFFAGLAVLHPRTQVPVRAILVQALWSCLLAISGTYDQLTDYVIFASWIFYGLVTSSVFVLRRKLKHARRPYRTLGYPLVPLLFVATAAWLVVNTLVARPVESAAGLVLIGAGLPFYLYFRRRRGSESVG